MGPNNNDHNIKSVHSSPFVLCCHNLRGSICYPQLSASKILDSIESGLVFLYHPPL